MIFDLIYPNFNFAHKYDERPSLNGEFEDHFHMIYEVLLFISGEAEFIIENKRFELKPGDLLFIPPGQHHSINVSESSPYERYVVKFPEYEVPKHLLASVRDKAGCYATEGTVLQQLFERLDVHVAKYSGVDKCGLLKCVLGEILYYSCSESKPNEHEIYHENMIEVLDYININVAKKITLTDICQHFHYSKSYICKEFQECMQVPIMQYIRTKKVLLAETLLNQGYKPIELYEQCGFSDYSTFFRAYKKIIGSPPSRPSKPTAPGRRVLNDPKPQK